jgi:hypothetical protein
VTLLQEPATKGGATGEILSVDQILNNYERAIGGRQSRAGLTSRVTRGTSEIPESGLSGTFEIYEVQPNKLYLVTKFANGVEVKIGFDGEVGWASNPQAGLHKLSGAELTDIRREAQFPEEINFREFFKQMRMKGKVRLDGREAYVIEAIPQEGSPWTIYFDARTWFRVRIDYTIHIEGRSEFVQCYLDDYRELENSGIKYPFRITERVAHSTIIEHVKEVHLNVPVDQALFRLPSFKVKVQQ